MPSELRRPLLLRRLGVFDLSLITVGTIVGSGIFRTPGVVAARAHSPALIVAAARFERALLAPRLHYEGRTNAAKKKVPIESIKRLTG